MNNAFGFTLAEIMISLSVMLVFVSATTHFATTWKKNKELVEVSSAVIAVESAILSTIADSSTYNVGDPNDPNSLINKMANGVESELTTPITLNIGPALGLPARNITTGTTSYFTKDITSCAGFTNPNCTIGVEVRVKKLSMNPRRYGFAYKMNTNPLLNLPPHTTVTGETGGVWEDDSYSAAVPQQFYRPVNLGICDPATTIGVHGINRDTGEVRCIRKDNGSGCPVGQFPVGLNFNPGTMGLDLECGAPAAIPTCGPNYSINNFSPAAAAAGSGARVCKRTVMDTSPGPQFGGPFTSSITGVPVCPPTTFSQSFCYVDEIIVMGICDYKECPTMGPDPNWVDDTDPNTPPGTAPEVQIGVHDCTPVLTVNHGTVSSTGNGTRDFSCTYTPPGPQPVCPEGGTITSYQGGAKMDIKCKTLLPDAGG